MLSTGPTQGGYMLLGKQDIIRVTGNQLNRLAEMVDTYLVNKASPSPKPLNLISAIKQLRSYVTINSPKNERLGLRESKLAIERLVDTMAGHTKHNDTRLKIVQVLSIHSVIVDFGEGKIEIDLDELQMRGLASINEIDISDLTKILDLVDMLKKWSAGPDISTDVD